MAFINPSSISMLPSGKCLIVWGSGTVTGVPNSLFNDLLNFQMGGPGASATFIPQSSFHNRGKFVGADRHTTQISGASTSLHEFAVAVNNALTGESGFNWSWVTPPRSSGSPGTATAPFVQFQGGDFNGESLSSVAVTGTNQYTGPTTDIRLTDTDSLSETTVPAISTDSNLFSVTTIKWSWSGLRYSRVRAGRNFTDIVVKVNGNPVTVNGGQLLASGSEVAVTIAYNVAPTDVVTITIPDDTFEISNRTGERAGLPNYSDPFSHDSNVESTDIPVINNRPWPQPAFSSQTARDSGSTLRFSFDANVEDAGFLGSNPIFVTGSIIASRQCVPNSVGSNYIDYTVQGTPLYNNEVVNASSVQAGVVRSLGAPSGQGENASFNPPSFNVGSNGTDPPAPTVTSATISTSGTQLVVVWDRAATFEGGSGTLTPENSPVGPQTLKSPTAGNSTDTWTFNLDTDPIRIGDSVALTFSAGYALDFQTNEPTAAISIDPIVNNSTILYTKPALLDVDILADGATVKLVFDRAVTIRTATLESSVRVLAQDVSDSALRSFTVLAGTGTVITTTETDDSVQFEITGGGTVFGNGVGGAGDPNDGDDVAIHTNGFAGIVSSTLSETAGQPALVDPIGTPVSETDFANSFGVDNLSTQAEPASPITPTYVEAEVFDQGDNPLEQFLRIRFDDGSATPIELQNNSILPTLSGSLTGTTTLQFEQLQTGAGDNDEIVYKVTGEKLKRSVDGEVVTLTVLEGLVISVDTATVNAASGPYVDNVAASFTNSSTVPQPQAADTPPVIQQIFIGADGLLVGVYYDVNINALSGQVTADGTLTGSRTGDFDVSPPPAQLTLATFELNGSLPIFRGETVFVDLPESLVSNASNGQESLSVTGFLADNNSLLPVPLAPILDTATLNDPGTIITATFNVPVVAGLGTGYCIASKTGRHDLTIASISANVVNIQVAGVVFEGETLELFFAKDFVKEGQHEFTPNVQLSNFEVDVSSRTSAAPDLPSNSTGLVPDGVS